MALNLTIFRNAYMFPFCAIKLGENVNMDMPVHIFFYHCVCAQIFLFFPPTNFVAMYDSQCSIQLN